MKNIISKLYIVIFSFALANSSFSQKINEKGFDQKKSPKDISSTEYSKLKKKGELSENYEYRISNGKVIPINVAARPSSPGFLTPCDSLPVQGPTGFNVEVDDGPLATIAIPFNFCFYGTTYTSLNLSANGNVQFSTSSTAFSSTGFPSNAVNMIAPFWADGETMVASGGRTYGKIYIDSHPTYMIISWDSLGYFNNNVDKLNSFQLVLTNGLDPILPVGKNVGFYYKKMQWTTGDASGGTGGFPATQPGTPATIGANQGNGIDYFLIGRFGVPGTIYDGPLGNSDGISWLDGKRFFFDVCPPVGSNQSPASTLIGPCDTVKVCGNDSLIIKNAFIGPEVTQTVSVTASAPTLGASFAYTVTQNGNNTDISMFVNGSTAPAGYHTVTMSATDNGTPPLTSSQTFIVFVDHTTINNLNGHIVFTPTIGICPGGSTTASIVVTGGAPNSYLWNNNASTTSTSYTITPALDSTVYVTIKSGYCQKTITNYIRVNPVPVAGIVGNLSLCSGTGTTTVLTATNTLNFAAQAPYTYVWTGSPLNPTPVNTQSVTAAGGTYSVVITNRFNCKSSAVASVTLNTTPSFTIVPTNTTICLGQQVPLNITFGTSVPPSCGLATSGCSSASTRTLGTGLSTSGTTSFPTPYSNYYKSSHFQMLFRATELTAAGVVAGKISSLAFNVSSLNSFSVALPNYTIKMKCTSAVNVSSTVFDNAGLSQVYYSPAYMPTTGVNTHNFSQPYLWDGVSNILVDICYDRIPGNYVSNGGVSAYYSSTAFISVRYDNSDGLDMCSNTNSPSTSGNRPNVRFGNCTANPSPTDFTYQWSPGTYLNNTTIVNPVSTPTSSIVYNVVVTPTIAPACTNSGTTSITVINPATPTITPVSPLCTNASSLALGVTPAGGTWAGSGVSPSGVLTPSLVAPGNNTYTYTVGSGTCSATGSATISVEQYVPSTITGTIIPQCIINAPVDLLALTTYTTGIWSGNGVTGTTFDPALAGAGTYTLTYTTNSTPTASLCPSSSTLEVTVISIAQPTITQVNPLCTNASSLSIIASPTGGVWAGTGVDPAGVFTPSLAVVGSNTYTYTVGTGTCSNTNTTTISVEQFVASTITGSIIPQCVTNPPTNLVPLATNPGGIWMGNGVSGSMFDPAISGAGTQTLTYTTNSSPTASLCPSTDTLEVSVSSVPQPSITAAGPFCDSYAPQLMTVDAAAAGGVWSSPNSLTTITPGGQFSPGSSPIGNNTIVYTLTNGPCVKTDSIAVTVVKFVSAALPGNLGPYCIYDASVNLQTIATNPGGTWTGPGVSGTIFTPAIAGAGTQTISYRTDPAPSGLCPDQAITIIIVNPKPEVNALGDIVADCNPLKVNYFTTSTATGFGSWNFGDGSTSANGLSASHTYTTPGTYQAVFTYTDNAGCLDTTIAASAVTVYPVPVAAFDASPDITTVVDGEVQFQNNTSDITNNTYTWDFGGQGYSSDVSPTYLFSVSGEFFVTLIATSPEGCQDTAVKKVTINPDVVLYVPNAFTPGGDGLNDQFQIFLPPTGVDFSTFQLTVYDRWGSVVYKTNDVNKFWNGSKNNSGDILKQDTYVYKISFMDEKKKYYEKLGYVTLLRK